MVKILAIFILLFACIFYEIFSYLSYDKKVVADAKYKGIINKFFSSKIKIIFVCAFLSFIFSFSMIFNFLTIEKSEFFYIFVFVPLIFLFCRFLVAKFLKNSFVNFDFGSKKIQIFLSCIFCVLFYSLFEFYFLEQEPIRVSIFEYLKDVKINKFYENSFLNELYAYSFYKQSAFLWFKNSTIFKHKILVFIPLFLNKIFFYTAILYIVSFVFSKISNIKFLKFGYFISTILFLGYSTFVLIYLNSYNKNESTKINKSYTQKSVEYILNSKILTLSQDEAKKLINDLEKLKLKNNQILKQNLELYIDEVYQNGAKSVAEKMADFNYSALSDYVLLFKGIFGVDFKTQINNKMKEFIDESFPKNFNDNLEKIISLGVKNYEKDIQSMISSNINLNIDLNLSEKILQNNNYAKRLGISAFASTSLIAAKIAIKSASKVASKASLSAANSQSGLVCGSMAFICVPVIASITWFGFDFIVAKADESLNKEEFKKKIFDDFMLSKQEFKKEIFKNTDLIFDNISKSILKKKN